MKCPFLILSYSIGHPLSPHLHLPQVLLNVLADEVHRAHQQCLNEDSCDPNLKKTDFLFQACTEVMKQVKGAYSIITMVSGVGMVAFRDPNGIRCAMEVITDGNRDGDGGDCYGGGVGCW
jgi:hypothetical protein